MSVLTDRKKITKANILQYTLEHEYTTKAELAKMLGLSMPTVINNMNELMADGIVMEVGELESTGGRKAKMLSICKDKRLSLGIEISKNHLSMVLVNLKGEIVKKSRVRLRFDTSVDYYKTVSNLIREFLEDQEKDKILGAGFALPGIVFEDDRIFQKSHTLNLENYSLKMFEEAAGLPVHFRNDANAAMLAELPVEGKDVVYLSLNNTLGGAILMNGKLYTGGRRKAGEFGHMILHPNGKRCYCGKLGCVDAYCAATALTDQGAITLEEFMESLKAGDEDAKKVWEQYLCDLAILITNLRMAYDTDIILGGDVGGYLADYHMELGEKLFQNNLFDTDFSYIKYCTYKKEAAAVGAAKTFFAEYLNNF